MESSKTLKHVEKTIQDVLRTEYGEKVISKARELAEAAVASRWSIDDILGLYDQYEEVADSMVKAAVLGLPKKDYKTLMENVELYEVV
jgi:hypothetical protein